MTRVRPLPRATLISLAMGVAVTACSSASTPSASASLPSSGEASASASPRASQSSAPSLPAALTISWADAKLDLTIGAVEADRGQFVAVSGDPSVRKAWTSDDAVSWSDHPVPEPIGCNELPDGACIERTAGMGQLERLGDTLYSIGTTTFFNDFARPVGWRWTDGEAWQAISSQSEFYGFGVLQDLTASDDALVAVRHGEALGPFGSSVWRWTSETSWVASNLASRLEPLDVFDTAWGSPGFVAVGAVPTPDRRDEEGTAAAWVSDDGLAWRPVDPPSGSARLCTVAATRMGFMVLGWTSNGPMIWRSDDGTSWTGSALGGTGAVRREGVPYFRGCAVTELEAGLLTTLTGEDGTLTWTSVDGVDWIPGPKLDLFATRPQVAALGDTVVAAGFRDAVYPSDPDATPVVMIGTVNP